MTAEDEVEEGFTDSAESDAFMDWQLAEWQAEADAHTASALRFIAGDILTSGLFGGNAVYFDLWTTEDEDDVPDEVLALCRGFRAVSGQSFARWVVVEVLDKNADAFGRTLAYPTDIDSEAWSEGWRPPKGIVARVVDSEIGREDLVLSLRQAIEQDVPRSDYAEYWAPAADLFR